MVNPAAIKTPAHYLAAIWRRAWLVLVIGVPFAILSSVVVLRQPCIYQARAEITIEPPELNPLLQTLIAHEIGTHDSISQEKYVPNRIALLQSKGLAEAVVTDSSIAPELTIFDDPAQELIIGALQVRPIGRTNWFTVFLEGKDPLRTKKVLELLLEKFKEQSKEENWKRMADTRSYADDRLIEMKKELERIDQNIYQTLKTVRTIGPGGRNIFEDQYVNLANMLSAKQMRIGELNQQMLIARAFPKADFGSGFAAREQQIAILEAEKRKWIRVLWKAKRIENARQFNHDPAVKEYAQRLDEIMNEIDELKSIKTEMAENPTEMILDQYRRELEDDKAQHQAVLTQMQDSMPEHQRFLSMVEDRKQAQLKLAEMQRNIDAFEILKKSLKEPVVIPTNIIEPTVPIRPSRTLYIGVGLILSFGLGVSVVLLLEHIDHSVRVPEHVTHGLTLPLLGVVPRIRRTALTYRAGHLWASGVPDSVEADAFRNIRASLLGVADRRGSVVTLLVTSPKAGDGKSTAALNLAATCARAGERTLLVDVDLRRPTLANVFPVKSNKQEPAHGLVEVLQGLLPWQKTLRRSELQNLDFIPTGNHCSVPIEILGSLELRQLLSALATHYDRVILDGPAVLGMADCRVLGRMVDTSILVIRSGVHQLVTLQRAKSMLEQSHVAIAGVIVNSLSEDLQNWSSYGYDGASASVPSSQLSWRRNDRVLGRADS
jgi:capsular exopolysaccharide synthesis family protein